MSKRKPMCQVPAGYAVIDLYEYRLLTDDVQRYCDENAKLRDDLRSRISEIDMLEKELDGVKEELERVKNAEDIWYKRSREFEDKLKALERASDASPENS